VKFLPDADGLSFIESSLFSGTPEQSLKPWPKIGSQQPGAVSIYAESLYAFGAVGLRPHDVSALNGADPGIISG
jgi:hypothetical protein